MSRVAREKSSTGIYHAILRGVNKQQIFECSEDYEQFVRILQRQCGLAVNTRRTTYINEELLWQLSDGGGATDEEEVTRHCYLYAWCLMGNHVHLLIRETDEEIGEVMKRIASSYVYYYNRKYDRVGHLFQERFKSEPVEDMEYFMTLIRYIHQNPLKPRLVDDLKDYEWSSWREYLGLEPTPFCSTKAVLDRISLSELKVLVHSLLDESETAGIIDYEKSEKVQPLKDEEIWQLIGSLSGARNATEFQALPRPYQKHLLYEVHEQGAAARTLSRLTGVSWSIVQRATSKAKEQLRRQSMVSDAADEEWQTYLDASDFDLSPEW